MGRFVIDRDDDGYSFTLLDDQGQLLLTSETYDTRQEALERVATIKQCAGEAAIRDVV